MDWGVAHTNTHKQLFQTNLESILMDINMYGNGAPVCRERSDLHTKSTQFSPNNSLSNAFCIQEEWELCCDTSILTGWSDVVQSSACLKEQNEASDEAENRRRLKEDDSMMLLQNRWLQVA